MATDYLGGDIDEPQHSSSRTPPVSRSLSSLPSSSSSGRVHEEHALRLRLLSPPSVSASMPTLPAVDAHASCLSVLQSLPLFRCSVTSKPYELSGPRVPRTIKGCGHTFSEEALLSLRGQANFITCPVCETQSSLPPDSGAEAFHVNQHLLAVMKELFDKSAAADALPKCDSDDCDESVALSCPDCEAHLCTGCFAKIHSVGRLRQHHSVPFVNPVLAPACFSNRCAKHPNYFYEVVCMARDCPDYKQTLCPMCEREHKQHKTEVIPIVAGLERHKLEDQIKLLETRLAKCNDLLARIADTATAISAHAVAELNTDTDSDDSLSAVLASMTAATTTTTTTTTTTGSAETALQQIRDFFAQQRARLQRREETLVESVRALAQKKQQVLSGQFREVGRFVADGYRACLKASLLLNQSDNTQFIKKNAEIGELVDRINHNNFLMVPRVTERINVFFDRDFGPYIDSVGRVEDDGVVTAPQQLQRRTSLQHMQQQQHLLHLSPADEPNAVASTPHRPPSAPVRAMSIDSETMTHVPHAAGNPRSVSTTRLLPTTPAPSTIDFSSSRIRFNRWSDKLTVTNEYRTISKHITGKKSNTFCSAGVDTFSVRIDDLPPAGNNWVIGWAHPSFPLDGWERGIACALMAAYDGVPYSSGGVVKLPLKYSSIQEPYSLQKGWIVHSKLDREKHTVSFAVNDEPFQVLLTNVPSDLHPFLRLHSVGLVLTLV